jgi:hypothetical protein
MTVGELIKQLQAYPSDARAVVSGYEGGYDDVTLVKEISVKPAVDDRWYYGRFENADPGNTRPGERAVLLFGRSRCEE